MSAPVRSGPGEGFSDAISIDFADPDQGLFGLVQIELVPNAGSARVAGLLFDHSDAIAAVAEEVALEPPPDWGRVEVGDAAIAANGGAATARLEAGGSGFEVEFAELRGATFGQESGAGLVAGASQEVAAGRVTGEIRRNGASTHLDCFGRAARTSGELDWANLSALRSLGAVFDDGSLLAVWAARPARAEGHSDDALSAAVVEERGPLPLERALLSTEYDEESRHRRANVEILPRVPEGEEEGPPLRAAGSIVCGTSLELAGLRLDTAFFRWSMDGKPGLGRYDVVRPC